jgi:hypothetical protein
MERHCNLLRALSRSAVADLPGVSALLPPLAPALDPSGSTLGRWAVAKEPMRTGDDGLWWRYPRTVSPDRGTGGAINEEKSSIEGRFGPQSNTAGCRGGQDHLLRANVIRASASSPSVLIISVDRCRGWIHRDRAAPLRPPVPPSPVLKWRNTPR